MIELYQAEWCPFSHEVRQRLTELGVPFVARPVEPDPHERDAMEAAVGERTIPALVLEDGTIVAGDTEEILEALDRLYPETQFTKAHHERRVEARMFE
ncbi:MAG TPA: glutaredoxin family protein [Baekduia sp.]|uniref:glutaredoxin family protein n=1 Tax=Baekduia sp. TaxID=2600305 RepID=UPI002BF0FC38|nr:glutaredoxin family protein [Baekduia sp.]HMJ35025.1 glutaredoxin family protein [Baekduia sp.]